VKALCPIEHVAKNKSISSAPSYRVKHQTFLFCTSAGGSRRLSLELGSIAPHAVHDDYQLPSYCRTRLLHAEVLGDPQAPDVECTPFLHSGE